VRNSRGSGKGVSSASLDGRPLQVEGGRVLLPLSPPGTSHEADIELG